MKKINPNLSAVHMKRKSTNKSLQIALIVIIVILGSWLFFDKGRSKTFAPPVKEITDNTVSSSATPVPTTSPTPSPTPEKTIDQSTLAKLSMPVLMYHHIRNYNDPSDQIGINLSVSPEKFATQLDLIQKDGYQTVTFQDIESGNIPEKPIILTFDDGYQNFYDYAYPELKKHNMKAVSFIITDYTTKSDYMNENEIKEISRNGIEIGSHTKSHPDLSSVTPTKANTEITESKSILENIIGKKIISICYPSGKYNDSVIAEVKAAGYSFATTTKAGYSKFASPFDLQRERVNSDTNIAGFLK